MFWNRQIRKTWGCLMRKFLRWHTATLLSARSRCMTVSMWHTLGAAGVQGTSIPSACLHRRPLQRSNKSGEDIKHCFSPIWLGIERFRRHLLRIYRGGRVVCTSSRVFVPFYRSAVSWSGSEGWAVCSKTKLRSETYTFAPSSSLSRRCWE